MNAAPLLERYRVFHSRDADETRAFLGAKGYRFDLSPCQARQLRTRINTVYMPSLYLGYIDYGSLPVTLSPAMARSDFLLQLPMRGQLAANTHAPERGPMQSAGRARRRACPLR
jgi:hypothetical protein